MIDASGADCGNCVLAYRVQLPGGDGTGAGERLKCSKAPVSRRARQGIDLRPATSGQPATPACTLHCTFTNWPYGPDGRDHASDDLIGTGRDHADDRGVYAVYRIFGIDPGHQHAWVELEAEMIPNAAAPVGYTAYVPQRSRPDTPHLYRFFTRLSRLHTANLTHPAGAGDCEHPLVRSGRVLLARPAN